MEKVAILLMVLAAAIIAGLGTAHLWLTFRGPKLLPRDRSVQQAMQGSSLHITQQTTVWRAWLGFNASHSLGAMLFGLIYGYLALRHADWLFASVFLLGLGLLFLLSFWLLARLYWFRTPLLGISLALVLYLSSLALTWLRP